MIDERVRPGEVTLAATVNTASRAADRWAGGDDPHPDRLGPGIELIAFSDPRYPQTLRMIENPPQQLYVRGSLGHSNDQQALAIVGSRDATPAGIHAAETIAGYVASRGHTVVSGLAAGIDAAAHRGALAVGGRTIAVVGTGVDRCYPASNATLQDRISQHGAVISQFGLGQPASKTTFPARNVLIAGLTRASLLVELTERSGTRIEATIAQEQGKPVLLWEPILGHESWARRFATATGAHFVDSASAIVQTLAANVAVQ